MKSIIAAGILLGCAHGAVAAPYVNIENNAGFTGQSFNSALTEVHAGYDFENGFYVQGGPAFTHVDGEASATDYSLVRLVMVLSCLKISVSMVKSASSLKVKSSPMMS